jgi:methylated-DNA-[protein]-cysteine S-methyltransferase
MLCGDEESLTALHLPGHWAKPAAGWRRDDARFADVARQLEQYFDGERTTFDIPLRMQGGPFEREVWAELLRIPYGETASYGEIARRVGKPHASRAVGAANGRNPIAIIVPCHRVIGSDGALTGYGGGLERKRALLDLEAGVASLV